MEERQKQLQDLKSYLHSIDTEVTMILQSLQWNRKRLLETPSKVTCQVDATHKMPLDYLEAHEKNCMLTSLGYSSDDVLLPDPPDPCAGSLVTFSKTDIKHIVNAAATRDPMFKRGSEHLEPLTLERLQVAYTPDERRAIHDAVVQAVPSCHDLGDLALSSSNEEKDKVVPLSRVEILAELRDMKRRRTKYRVAAKTRNYSDVLRDVIRTQMEMYTEVKTDGIKAPTTATSFTEDRKDGSKKYKNVSYTKIKEEKLDDRSKDKHNTGGSRERCQSKDNRDRQSRSSLGDRYEDKRSNADGAKRRDHGNEYRQSRYKEQRHKSEREEYNTHDDRDKRQYSPYKGNSQKYDKSVSRQKRSSSRERSKYEGSHNSKRREYSDKDKSHKGSRSKEKRHQRHYDSHKNEDYWHEDKRRKYK